MRRSSLGFSLIEVMIAMTILAAALTWIVVAISRNIQAENHAKLMTTATFLARAKMNDLEDDLYDKGFSDFEKDLTGNFEDRGFERFSWRLVVDKVQMPGADTVQTMIGKAGEAKAAITGQDAPSKDDTSSPIGAGIAALSGIYPVLKDVLENGIRRLNVEVLWSEGHTTYEVTVVAYYTDPRKVDQAAASFAGGGLNGAAGTSSTSSTSTNTSGTPASTSTTK